MSTKKPTAGQRMIASVKQAFAFAEGEENGCIEFEEYRQKIRDGIESGEGFPAEDVFARLEAKYQYHAK
jgi:hypothetical protein